MPLLLRGELLHSVFSLLGADENSATFAMGWALEMSPAFRDVLLTRLRVPHAGGEETHIHLQAFAQDRGFTDIELTCGTALDAIIEAKVGWELPTDAQLRRYRPRLEARNSKTKLLVSISATSADIALRRLPRDIDGLNVVHLSWGTIGSVAMQASRMARGHEERIWLRELIRHIRGFAAMDRVQDNSVYVVSLGRDPMRDDGQRTWIDVVEQDHCYFHPVGSHWPTQPPNYVGFRYRGRVQSIHRVEHVDIVSNLAAVNASWPATDTDHFVYKLGPAMRPPRELRAGGPGDAVQRSARVWCAIDTLLSGQFDNLGQARDETRRRLDAARADDV